MIKKWVKNFLEKLAKANQESFGNEPLDCCKLGRKSQVRN